MCSSCGLGRFFIVCSVVSNCGRLWLLIGLV